MFGRKRPESDGGKADKDLIPEDLIAPLAKVPPKPPTTTPPQTPPFASRVPPFAAPRPTTPSPTPEGSTMSQPTMPSPLSTPLRPSGDTTPRLPDAYARPSEPSSITKPEYKELRQLIVGREISLTGEINSCDRLLVEGNVEANLANCREVEIAESGLFKGTAHVDNVELRGRFEGTLTVKGRLLIRATGKITGSITYGQIEIECGGQVSGEVQARQAEPALESAPPLTIEPPAPSEPSILRRDRPSQPVMDVNATQFN